MRYYLPINSTSLAHYFACACVKPAKFFDNKNKDIQDIFGDALLISTELGTHDTDCCLELVLTNDEIKKLLPCSEGFYLLPIPLPITRIRKVFFRDQRQLEQTLTNINLSAAFLPSSLAGVAQFTDIEFDANHFDLKGNIDYSREIELYDRILGALALMKIAKEPYMNYSENYASTLSFFSDPIKVDLIRQRCPITDKFFGLFSRNGSFVNRLHYLEKKITNEDLDQIAKENGQSIERSYTTAINLDKLTGMTYLFAVLLSYGVGDEAATKKIDGLISKNFDSIKDGKAEGVALYYGYNRGYSVFNNSYGTEATGRQSVKYLLDSQLDYYTIESVYQFVFYKKAASSRFPYLDEWCPRKQMRLRRKTDYMVLDTVFVGKKKPSVFSREYFQSFLEEIKTVNIFNSSIAALIDQFRFKIAEDTKDEIEEEAEEKIAESEAKWSSLLSNANVEIESLKRNRDAQEAIIAELQKQNDILHMEIETLKSQGSLPPAGSDNESLPQSQETPESVPDIIKQEDSPINTTKSQSKITKSDSAKKKSPSTTSKKEKKESTGKKSKKEADKDNISTKESITKPSEEASLSLFGPNE